MTKTPTDLEKVSNLLQTISPAPRLEILLGIGEGEACVCHLEAMFGLRQATLSQHLMALREAGVVTDRRERPVAFATILPGLRKHRCGLDLLRHRTDVEPGMMEYVVLSLLRWARAEGLSAVELGLTPLHRLSFEPVRARSLFPLNRNPQMDLFAKAGAA